MLTENAVKTIERMLSKTTLSQREIARRLAVNRETVNRIARGKRFDVIAHKRQQAAETPTTIKEPVRCSGCGGRIFVIPCQACKLTKSERRRQRFVARFHGLRNRQVPQLEIELLGKDNERYLAVRTAKQRRGEKPVSNLGLLQKVLLQGENLMPIFDNVKYVRWFLSHVDQLMPFLELPEQLRTAASLNEKWLLLKEAGDVLVGLIDSFPIGVTTQACSTQALQFEVEAQGIPWDALLEFLPILIRLITLIQGEET